MKKNFKNVCFVPIKKQSKRVPGKNLRHLADKKLYRYMIETIVESNAFNDVFIDTDSQEIIEYCVKNNIKTIKREPELSKDTANGNDLLNSWFGKFPNYDYYYQLFVTSPFTTKETIKKCVDTLQSNDQYDSVLTVSEKCGFYWFDKEPINYRPPALPRTQDAKKVFSETTALYGITNKSLSENKCRMGKKPYFCFVSDVESLDIDSEFDFFIAEQILKFNKEKKNV
jgi:N-acylneuraminate cytidylyltransferase